MNRIKVWLYALAVVALAAAGLRAHAVSLRARELASLDARLAVAVAQADAAARALSRDAGAAAALAARDARLIERLHAAPAEPPPPAPRGKRAKAPPAPPPPDAAAQDAELREAAAGALAAATKVMGAELPGAAAVAATARGPLPRKGAAAEDDVAALLRAAAGGAPQRAWLREEGALASVAAAPAGEGAAVAVLVPLDLAFVKRAAALAGADLTLVAPDAKPLSSARPADAQALSGWTPALGAAANVGAAAKVDVAVGPLKVPGLPALLGAAPALRVRAVPLDGVKGGFLVASVQAGPALAPVLAFEWLAAAALALALVVGLVLGLFVRSSEAPPAVPEGLLEAAARIERGDFAARAPTLAGTFGTLATALNRAAELAGPAAAAATARASVTDEFYARAPGAASAAPAPEPTPGAGLFEAAPATPRPAPTAAPPAAPDLLQAAARAAAPATVAVDEEAHWQQVFQDFLRTRASCGETSDGLTYERFRVKLESNKAALAAKYACKTVKFQVYVKEGKAALKATPVK
jgi:hypothetical protein